MSDAVALPSPRAAVDDECRHEVVAAVAAAGASAAPVSAALQAALDGVCDALGFPVAHAYLYDAGLDRLVSTPLWHLSNPFRFNALVRLTASAHVVPGVGLVGRTLHEARPLRLGVIHDDPLFRRSRVALTAGLRAALACPVVVDGRVVAVLEFFAPRPIEDDPHLMAFLDGVTTSVAAVVVEQSLGSAAR